MISFIQVDLELNKKPIFRDLNLTIQSGELVYLVGRSGSGKTTMLKSLYMDIRPTKGEIQIAGYSSRTIRKRMIPLLRRRLGIVFQDFRLLEDRNVYDNLAFVLKVTGTKEKLIRDLVMHALQSVGLEHAAKEMPLNLSGGEQQRVAIARAIVREPLVVLADEPTGNLDPDTSIEILEYLKAINSKGITVLIGTHDYELVRHSPSRTLQICDMNVRESCVVPSETGYRVAVRD
ncbi:MAG: ATP-binding cassette domain-containing protein [Chlorobium sp.]|jgi:cell division transport system ATP-binding protein|uniref:cell division ATP-binding protein FtsE n=1 Tax=Chlorobium sp. TaxID=1095 RepID=UPI0025BC9C76|nr:ATP-binding cassette domain-containing protein [Chlorobium sp.]MCF8216144.1 ATP-binding cassette domain-containing protein [Chlorobium sp.]MCF8271106.1 ATP-binding cassette domain-containing protein [Chlorobium sp.]MCF8287420.1 ATP-binding cassette domain-containing protein [Chlorobium sp.]MCF8291019.1 ATP-binding cassette domain-containing protein [Chlorobium sp.]MCF8385114.1 ATP-binding cassette domain-containing protein [Chlorobium sp.]